MKVPKINQGQYSTTKIWPTNSSEMMFNNYRSLVIQYPVTISTWVSCQNQAMHMSWILQIHYSYRNTWLYVLYIHTMFITSKYWKLFFKWPIDILNNILACKHFMSFCGKKIEIKFQFLFAGNRENLLIPRGANFLYCLAQARALDTITEETLYCSVWLKRCATLLICTFTSVVSSLQSNKQF